jgi:CheY-like chemotaxis protein
MTVHVLIVEDDTDFVDAVTRVITGLPGTSEITVATSRDAAYDHLSNRFFDLIVLDLKIPTIDSALDANPLHGHAVFGRACTIAPGTPILVLTGSPAEDFIPDLLAKKAEVDVWGEGKTIGTVMFLRKGKFDEATSVVAPILAAVNALTDVELDKGQVELTTEDDRLVRIFVRRSKAVRGVLTQLGGGLSGAKVVRLRVTNNAGVRIHDAVAKLGSHAEVRDETQRFDNFVSRLNQDATPRKLATLEFGARAKAGVFYGLAEGFDTSAFEICQQSDGRAEAAIKAVEALTKRWVDGVPQTRQTIGSIRRRLLSDADLAALRNQFDLAWTVEFEAHEIQVHWACVHGDLHGSNILLSPQVAAVLIDYGDVGDGPACLDPITLEMSLLFHPQKPLQQSNWPSLEQAAHWGDLTQYLVGCPAGSFVSECRGWATRVAAGNREIAGSAYAYLIRQLKYQDTNKDLILALLAGVRSFYAAT